MSQQNRYSANLEKTEDRRNWKHTATSGSTTLQGPNPLRRRTSQTNLLTPIDQGMRQNAPHFRNRLDRDSQNEAQLEQLGSH